MATGSDNATNTLERTYALALLEMADKEGRAAQVADELKQLGRVLEDQPDLKRLLASRILSVSDRADSIDKIFKGEVSDLVYRFLQVANLKGRLEWLPGMVTAFSQLLDERKRGCRGSSSRRPTVVE